MDTLFIGEIPSDFHYAEFSNGYITLYSQPVGYNNSLPYYRVYTNNKEFYYSQGTSNFGSYTHYYFTDIPVSNSWWYRRDLSDILLSVFIISLFFIFIFNIITSCVKRGGLFGGLL